MEQKSKLHTSGNSREEWRGGAGCGREGGGGGGGGGRKEGDEEP